MKPPYPDTFRNGAINQFIYTKVMTTSQGVPLYKQELCPKFWESCDNIHGRERPCETFAFPWQGTLRWTYAFEGNLKGMNPLFLPPADVLDEVMTYVRAYRNLHS